MRVLLAYPYCLEARLHEEDASVVPMGLYYIGAVLKSNHHQVEMANFHLIGNDREKIIAVLNAVNPDVIGFSIVNANRWGAIEIAGMAKQMNPNITTVIGGPGATFLWKLLLGHFKEIDYAVIGEGETAFLDLINCLERNQPDAIAGIQGIAYREKDNVISTGKAPQIQDIDTLPNPADYFTYQHVAMSRGCPNNCTFCGSPQFWGRHVRFHSPVWFVNQLEALYQKGIRHFYFSDDNFTMDRNRVMETCRLIQERIPDITWVAISRVSYVDEEMIRAMRKAGCIQISYGVESGSESIRRVLNKRIRTDQVKRAFEMTQKYGILARAYFIYGCPGETPETIQETIRLMEQIQPLSVIFYMLAVFPGTAMYSDYMKKYHIPDQIWLKKIEDILYFEYDPELTEQQVLAFGKKLRTSYYQRLPDFVDSLELTKDPEFSAMNAGFLSRLAMTFSHGDYSRIDAIGNKDAIAQRIYQRALAFYPDHRAFLGLAILLQKRGDFNAASEILTQGLKFYNESEALNVSMGINLVNLGCFEQALPYLLKFPDSQQALYYAALCYQQLGDIDKAQQYASKLNSMQQYPGN